MKLRLASLQVQRWWISNSVVADVLKADDRGFALNQGPWQMSQGIRVHVVLVLDQVSEIRSRLPRVVVRDGEVRSKEPPPADVQQRVRDRRICKSMEISL